MCIINGRLYYGKQKQPHCKKWHSHPKQDWYEIVANVYAAAKSMYRKGWSTYSYVWCKITSKNILNITSAGVCSWIEILWVNAYTYVSGSPHLSVIC